ncbi:aspartyl-phosphate phosphatase Spo0E family protein [Paenibacillus sp. P96]|uniref:Aspartyl-phosphate phosphatase Spo0E family protein n=1 Tax=Paenibacillus zeirhizosphaerae TaxID=2987519 RepID=A0ABT9FV08_9BACL|nr:aspartyl-phosphate phosphatase Spo0E family protein [Paenibacillus sp. P96]MDP4098535.1 aspartyl-phosphate phosphatase Spo0E family protein [Paenibacillus sp. P96]
MMDLREMENRIEGLREKLLKSAAAFGRNDDRVIKTSQQLDHLLNIYLYAKIQLKKTV